MDTTQPTAPGPQRQVFTARVLPLLEQAAAICTEYGIGYIFAAACDCTDTRLNLHHVCDFDPKVTGTRFLAAAMLIEGEPDEKIRAALLAQEAK